MRVRFPNWACSLAVALLVCAPAGLAQGGRRAAGPRPGGPGRVMRAPAPLALPGKTILDRWDKMSPDERRRALDNLPPERRKVVEQRLQRYEQLSPEERERLKNQYQRFRQFPPEQQDAARRLFNRFNQLPEDRRPIVRRESERLRRMDPAERSERMNSDEFRNRYTLSEQQLLQDLMKLTPATESAQR